jgi:hypothetical protein
VPLGGGDEFPVVVDPGVVDEHVYYSFAAAAGRGLIPGDARGEGVDGIWVAEGELDGNNLDVGLALCCDVFGECAGAGAGVDDERLRAGVA